MVILKPKDRRWKHLDVNRFRGVHGWFLCPYISKDPCMQELAEIQFMQQKQFRNFITLLFNLKLYTQTFSETSSSGYFQNWTTPQRRTAQYLAHDPNPAIIWYIVWNILLRFIKKELLKRKFNSPSSLTYEISVYQKSSEIDFNSRRKCRAARFDLNCSFQWINHSIQIEFLHTNSIPIQTDMSTACKFWRTHNWFIAACLLG